MLERQHDLPPGIEGIKATGKVTTADYKTVFEPSMRTARLEGRRVRLLYELGPEFEGFSLGGVWEDMKSGSRFEGCFEGCAIVSDRVWVRESTRLFAHFLPCPVRVFSTAERQAATQWLRSLPEGSSVSHRLFGDDGVVVIEVKKMLRSFDFDPVVNGVNSWLADGHELKGLVIHAHDYGGWEKLSAFFRHLQFQGDAEQKLGRVALSGDLGVASLAPLLSQHFVRAEVDTFGYDDLKAAIAWARSGHPSTAVGDRRDQPRVSGRAVVQ